MRKYLFLFFLLPHYFHLSAQPTLNEIRESYFEMNRDSCDAMKLFISIKEDEYPSAILQAYGGALEAAAAECVKGGLSKLEYFSRGKKNLEAALQKDSHNVEIRFLRFATQVNAPDFLEYDNIREDKPLILEKLPLLLSQKDSRDFWLKAADFMIKSGKLSKEESAGIRKLLEKY